MLFANSIAFYPPVRLKPIPTEGWLKCAEMYFYKITWAIFPKTKRANHQINSI